MKKFFLTLAFVFSLGMVVEAEASMLLIYVQGRLVAIREIKDGKKDIKALSLG